MWGRKSAQIADLRAALEAAHRAADQRVEEATDEVQHVAYVQYAQACDRAVAAEKRVRFLEEAVEEQERVIAVQHAAVDHVTGMDAPQMRADLEEAGRKWRAYLDERGKVTCRVQGVAS